MTLKFTKQGKLIVAALAVSYALFRFWGATDSCLWFDEIFSVHAAGHPWGEIIPFVAKDLIHPPLFYLLLKIWIGIGGESVFWLRLFPVLTSVLALAPLWFICRELKLRQSSTVIAFGLFATNGALIKYAQEVRMYSLLLFLGLVSVWLFSRYYFRGKSFWMLVIANVLLVYTHYFGWFVIGAEVLLIGIFQRIKSLRTLLMGAVTTVAFFPWLLAINRFAESGPGVSQNIGWMPRPGVSSIFQFIFDLIDPFYFQQSSADAAAYYLVAVPLLLVFVSALIVYLIRIKESQSGEQFLFLTVLASFPILCVFALSWLLPVSIWGSRHLLIVFVPIMLLIGIFLGEIRPVLLRNCFLAAIAVLSVTAFILQSQTLSPRYSWCAWNDVACEFLERRNAGETLYAFEDLAAYHLWFSFRGREDVTVAVVKGTGVPEDTAYFLPRGFDGVKETDDKGISGEWIWVAFRAKEVDATKPPLSTLISRGYEVKETMSFVAQDSTVYLVKAKKR